MTMFNTRLTKVLVAILLLVSAYGLVRAVELLSQVGRYQKYWQNRSLQSQAEDSVLYIALGDSTTQGIGASLPQKGYVGLIASRLENENRRPVRVINLSQSGATAKDVLERQLPKLERYQTKDAVVTLQIGSNDMSDFDSVEFRKTMSAIMGRLPKHTVVGDVPYFGGGRHRSLEPQVIKANRIIHKLAQKNNLRVARIHEITKRTDSIRNYAIDFFHPSNRAYRFWTEAFIDELKLKQPGDQRKLRA